MNWLAHLFLSENNVEIRLGNILADIVKGRERQQLNSGIQRGIECHQIIDKFTDNHPIFKRSQQRFSSQYRRFSGVFVDIFYDHFLAKNWSDYADVTLDEFTNEIYTSFREYSGEIPVIVSQVIGRIAAEDWLGSYRDIDGVEKTLIRISNRLSRRLQRPFTLNLAIQELTNNYDDFEQDFQEFFPALNLYVENWHLKNYHNNLKIEDNRLVLPK